MADGLATFSLPHARNPDDLKEVKYQRKFCVCTDSSGVVGLEMLGFQLVVLFGKM